MAKAIIRTRTEAAAALLRHASHPIRLHVLLMLAERDHTRGQLLADAGDVLVDRVAVLPRERRDLRDDVGHQLSA